MSAAVAVRVMPVPGLFNEAPAMKLCPLAGLVRLTVGAWLTASAGCTVTLCAALVVTALALSVALAVI